MAKQVQTFKCPKCRTKYRSKLDKKGLPVRSCPNKCRPPLSPPVTESGQTDPQK